jgi:hypothetical protein
MVPWSYTLNKIKSVFRDVTPCSLVGSQELLPQIWKQTNFTYLPSYMTFHHKRKAASVLTTVRIWDVTKRTICYLKTGVKPPFVSSEKYTWNSECWIVSSQNNVVSWYDMRNWCALTDRPTCCWFIKGRSWYKVQQQIVAWWLSRVPYLNVIRKVPEEWVRPRDNSLFKNKVSQTSFFFLSIILFPYRSLSIFLDNRLQWSLCDG